MKEDIKKCSIPNTHKRLLEAHRLWHQTLENYFEPEGFRTNLNACIQALRNLTFALQAEQKNITNFGEWYLKWQERMRKDPMLKWLNDARVTVVHQGDLETKSTVNVTVHNYLDIVKAEFEVPLYLASVDIAKFVAKSLPKELIRNCIAVIERRWIAADMQENELLEVLGYSYTFLFEMVKEAHEIVGHSIQHCEIRDKLHTISDEELNEGKFKCLSVSKSIRTKRISLDDFSELTSRTFQVSPDPDLGIKAAKRYKINAGQLALLDSFDIFDYVYELNEVAKKVLVKDKYHRSLLFLYIPQKEMKLVEVEPSDRVEKFAIMRRVADLVKQSGASAIFFISESWITSNIDAALSGTPVEDIDGREEALTVTGVNSEGMYKGLVTKFSRGLFGNIKLQPTVETDDVDICYYLEPILKVWNISSKDLIMSKK